MSSAAPCLRAGTRGSAKETPRSATAHAHDLGPFTRPGLCKGLSLVSFYKLVFFLKGASKSYQL